MDNLPITHDTSDYKAQFCHSVLFLTRPCVSEVVLLPSRQADIGTWFWLLLWFLKEFCGFRTTFYCLIILSVLTP